MRHIIVNVIGLSIEEKQRVNEALAKIMLVEECAPPDWSKVRRLYSKSCTSRRTDYKCRISPTEEATHTYQQVLKIAEIESRRKIGTHIVNGVEVPDLRFTPKRGEDYLIPNPVSRALVAVATRPIQDSCIVYKHRKDNKICYEKTERGKQAAILHAKAWLGIA